MDKAFKGISSVLLLVAIVSGGYLGWGFLGSYKQSVDDRSLRSFTVTAEGKTTATPDVAQFTYSVITEGGKDVTALMTDNTTKMNKINEFVKANGVEAKDIVTQTYSLDPRYQYSSCRDGQVCPPPEIAGYTITQSVLVKVRNFSKLGTLLSGVVQNGANSVSQFNLTIDDQEQYQKVAREQAMAKAREKATAIAESAGFKLGRLTEVHEEVAGNPVYAIGMGGASEAKAPAYPTPSIEPGSQDVKITVSLSYEIR